MPFTSAQLRQKYIDFFVSKAHSQVTSASTIPDVNDQTVLFTTAGMQQFVPNLMGKPHPQGSKLLSVQKCVRTVDIDEVGDNRHLTFFEMLGNWSLGDYFKKESIAWSYEFLIDELKIPKEKLWVTVYGGDEKLLYDQESHNIWKEIGIPEERIVGIGAPTDPEKRRRKGRGDNFWAAGPTGPCGPCSEMFIWLGEGEPAEGQTPETDEDNFIEVWNNVFMAFEQMEDTSLVPLKNKNVDTGMGLERLTMIIQGKTTVFETDMYDKIIAKIEKISGKKYPPYGLPLPSGEGRGEGNLDENNPTTRAFRVIADHIRCSSHLIADGVAASNEGRGYVLRRLLRRAVRFGKNLGIKNFLSDIAKVYIDEYKAFYPELGERQQVIFDAIKIEEEQFLKTLERGEKKLEELIMNNGQLIMNFSGKDAFLLSDTYGFPKDLTRELAEEKGIKIDEEQFNEEFEAELKLQKERSRANQNFEMKGQDNNIFDNLPATEFIGDTGMQLTDVECTVLAFADDGDGKARIVLDKTPFYAEGGGQVGDRGQLTIDNGQWTIHITDTKKLANGVFVHYGEYVGVPLVGTQGDQKGTPLQVNQSILASVNTNLRARTIRHHSAAHLLQAALFEVLGDGIEQAGSLVDENRTRFDFSYPKAMTADEIKKTEMIIAQWVLESHPITVEHMPIDEAKARGAVALFSEKYGDTVRTVKMGGITSPSLKGIEGDQGTEKNDSPLAPLTEGGTVSFELCGGTHITNTSEIGAVKIISETSVASGVRRIEMVVGMAAQEYLLNNDNLITSLAGTLKTAPGKLEERIGQLVTEKKEMNDEIKEMEKKLMSFEAEEFFVRRKTFLSLRGIEGEQITTICEPVPTHDMKKVGGMARALSSKKVDLVALFTEDGGLAIATQKGGVDAREVFKKIQEIGGGNGGGSPFFVQGKGVNLERFPEVREVVEGFGG